MTETKKRARTASQTIAEMKYQAEHIRRIVLNLNDRTDADIIARLESEPSMQGFVKTCIRAYLAREGGDAE